MLGHIQFFENLTDMMQRIGGHLTYLAKYATGIAFQNSDEVQEVQGMCENVVLSLISYIGSSCSILRPPRFLCQGAKALYSQGRKAIL